MKRLMRSLLAVVLVLMMLISGASALSVDEALELLELEYLREIPQEAYEAETLEELFIQLGDMYTYYMSAEEYQAFLDSVESTVELVGIGVSIQYTAEGILVVEPIKGGSAYEKGILPGDLIVAVDGESCVPADESHRSKILGEEGTEVTVTVLRGEELIDFVLTRRQVVINNTDAELLDERIGLIQCSSFGSDTGALFLDAVETYNDAADIWLVDMRSNSGGYSNAAVDALGVFAGEGMHLYLQDNAKRLYYYAYWQPFATDKPMIVLVDGYTASAAEAFTAGVRDYRLGVSVGSRTYGKGVAQVVYDENTHPEYFDGDAMKLTAYRFYSAGGITNDLMGVIPTILVPDVFAPAVALALCGNPSAAQEDTLSVSVAGYTFLVDTATTAPEVLSVLLSALPPSAELRVFMKPGEWGVCNAPAGAKLLGIEYESRWLKDAADSTYFEDEINTLATYGILTGDEDGNFHPQRTMRRDEVCGMLANALGLVGSSRNRFSDVTEENPYVGQINALADLGLVNGVGGGLFCPEGTMTQQEYFTLLGRAVRYLNVNYDAAVMDITQEHLDVVANLGFSSWAQESVALLDLVDALCSSTGELTPKAPILKEEAAGSLYAILVGAGLILK